jgi:hypothetical protein
MSFISAKTSINRCTSNNDFARNILNLTLYRVVTFVIFMLLHYGVQRHLTMTRVARQKAATFYVLTRSAAWYKIIRLHGIDWIQHAFTSTYIGSNRDGKSNSYYQQTTFNQTSLLPHQSLDKRN